MRFSIISSAALVAVIVSTAVDSATAAVIRFRETVRVESALVVLGDIADVLDRDPRVIERLKRITLVPAPAPGGKLRIDFDTVKSRLQAQGVDLLHTDFTGSSAVYVTSSGTLRGTRAPATLNRNYQRQVASWQIKRAEKLVGDAVTLYLQRRAPELGYVGVTLEIDENDVPRILTAAQSGYHIEGGQQPWDAVQDLSVRFLDRKEELHVVRFVCRATTLPRVVSLKYQVPRGHMLAAHDLELRQVQTPGSALTTLADAVGKEVKRPMRKGQVLKVEDVRIVPLIRSNDIVSVFSRVGSISVEQKMKSKSDGAKGDTVTLMGLNGRQKLLAVVTAYRQAEVIGSDGSFAPDLQEGASQIRFQTAATVGRIRANPVGTAFRRQPTTFAQRPTTYSRRPKTYRQRPTTFSQPSATFPQRPATQSRQPASFAQQPASLAAPSHLRRYQRQPTNGGR